MKRVVCPQCKRPVEYSEENRFRPFCSERCKLVDLGAWMTETYCIPDADCVPSGNGHEDDKIKEP